MAIFSTWGVDYVKVDRFILNIVLMPALHVFTFNLFSCNRDVEPEHWAKFRDAINATGRPIVFSIIAQGQKDSWTWGNATGEVYHSQSKLDTILVFYWFVCSICKGNLWRTTGDIMNSFRGFTSNLDRQVLNTIMLTSASCLGSCDCLDLMVSMREYRSLTRLLIQLKTAFGTMYCMYPSIPVMSFSVL